MKAFIFIIAVLLVLFFATVSYSNAELDVKVDVSSGYSSVFPGEDVLAEITVNLKNGETVDVITKYSIKDSEGAIIVYGSSTVAARTQVRFVRELMLPLNIEPGNYIFFAEAKFDDSIGDGSDSFEVIERPIFEEENVFLVQKPVLLGVGALLTVFLIFIVFSFFDMLKHHRILRQKPIDKNRVKKNKRL